MIAIIITILILILLILLTMVGNYFYTIALKPGGFAKLFKSTSSPDAPDMSSKKNAEKEWWSKMPLQTMNITTKDGNTLQGYYITNENPTDRLVILAHGYTAKASEMAIYAEIYYAMGFDIFAADNRGHGESEGKAIGMGWLDRFDYMQWMELLVSKKGQDTKILLHGHSMGGAIVSILAGEQLLPNVKGIISDCSYDSVKNELAFQLKSMFKLPAFPIIPITSLVTKIRAGYFLGEADVTAQVARSQVPILYIHGAQDTFVPFEMVRNLYDATAPSLRQIWEVENARHIESIQVAYDGYVAHITDFVKEHLTST